MRAEPFGTDNPAALGEPKDVHLPQAGLLHKEPMVFDTIPVLHMPASGCCVDTARTKSNSGLLNVADTPSVSVA